MLTAAEIEEILDFLGNQTRIIEQLYSQKAPLFKNVFKLKMNLR